MPLVYLCVEIVLEYTQKGERDNRKSELEAGECPK